MSVNCCDRNGTRTEHLEHRKQLKGEARVIRQAQKEPDSAESKRTSHPNANRGGPGQADQQTMPSPQDVLHSFTTAVLMIAAVSIGFGVGIAASRLLAH